jgi:hypothetical protein
MREVKDGADGFDQIRGDEFLEEEQRDGTW